MYQISSVRPIKTSLSVMALHSCILSLATVLLLIFSVTTTVSGECDNSCRKQQELSKLFEEALVNSSDSLWQLQQIYFDPYSEWIPALVYLSVLVTVNDVINGTPDPWCDDTTFDYCSGYNDYINQCETHHGQWLFSSDYALRPFPGSSDLTTLLLSDPRSSDVFYAFDPSFYTIMKALASSLGPIPHTHDDVIQIHINTTLHDNPCQNDAVRALEMVLMWVSFHVKLFHGK